MPRFCPPIGLAAVACCVAVTGCGDGRLRTYPVSGSVVFEDGRPVRNASIELLAASGGPSPRGRVDADGGFSLGTYEADDGAPEGDYRVVVIQAIPPGAAEAIASLGEEHAAHAATTQMVAPKHASPDTSGVTFVVPPRATLDARIVVEAR